MEILNIKLVNDSLENHTKIVDQCKNIIFDNLEANGGTLKQANLFERDFEWENLIVAMDKNKVVGFLLIRQGNGEHDLRDIKKYHYISDVVVANGCKGMGIGTTLLSEAINMNDLPIVASVLKDNVPSIKLLSKYMTKYGASESGKYLRFVDNATFARIYA